MVLLPLIGLAALGIPLALALTAEKTFWPEDQTGGALLVLIFTIIWLLVLSLWCLGFPWVLYGELRRRRDHPCAQEDAARRQAFLEKAEQTLVQCRWFFQTGGWFFLAGLPGLAMSLGARWLGNPPPGWALLMSFPLAALAPLWWMQATKLGIAHWWAQGRPSKWLKFSTISLAAYIGVIWIVVFSFLRSEP